MFSTQPVGRIIVYASMQDKLIKKPSLENSASGLIALIKDKIQTKSIDEVSGTLLAEIFRIKFDILEWLAENDSSANEYSKKINKQIAQIIQPQAYSSLAKSIAEVLAAMEKISAASFNENVPNKFDQVAEGTIVGYNKTRPSDGKETKPDYDTLKLFSLHPSPQISYIPKWIDSSLKIEMGLMIADLIFNKKINFSTARIKKELIPFLNNSIIRYGAYSIFTDFWHPETSDKSELVNKMEILAATYYFDNKLYIKSSKEELFRMLHN